MPTPPRRPELFRLHSGVTASSRPPEVFGSHSRIPASPSASRPWMAVSWRGCARCRPAPTGGDSPPPRQFGHIGIAQLRLPPAPRHAEGRSRARAGKTSVIAFTRRRWRQTRRWRSHLPGTVSVANPYALAKQRIFLCSGQYADPQRLIQFATRLGGTTFFALGGHHAGVCQTEIGSGRQWSGRPPARSLPAGRQNCPPSTTSRSDFRRQGVDRPAEVRQSP